MENQTDNTRPDMDNDQPKQETSFFKEMLSRIDTEFPLSGAETNEELEAVLEDDDAENDEETDTDSEPKPEHKSWLRDMMDNVDTDFPLSGGGEEQK